MSASDTAYHQRGSGPPLILVHGVGLLAESWTTQIEALSPLTSVYAIDLPGHGSSPAPDWTNPSLGDFTAALDTFVDEVVKAPAIVIGHSLGALIALEFAGHFPHKCSGIAALNAIYRRTPAARAAVRARADALRAQPARDIAVNPVRRWFGTTPAPAQRELAAQCAQWLRANDVDNYAKAYTSFADSDGPDDGLLESIAVPALFLTGEADPHSTPAMSIAMAALVKEAEVEVIAGARHLVQMTHPRQVNAALENLLRRCKAIHAAQREALS